ncbi:hypothetical protein DFH08DRAFT_764385 [Mycena albidolilacea]|uniref:F-box domain-containing protein n=1 Tax=Mycena albidolilacea TaxID=1033008 RepID=A0AAD7F5C2_9AGAR|nr:hypothetical protein DFH08DRAFT_764385 [Mycena albidolilacea]
MHLPEELICLILAKVYYINPPFNTPDYHTLSACSLLSSHWRGPAQTLLFRRITLKAAAAFAKFADTASNKALLSHVRALSIALTQNLGRADLCLVSTLVSILGHCPQLYELSINAQLFSLGEDISSISAIVHAASISIRSLRLMECSVHSPILYELIGLFPSVEFLTLGVEIAAAPPSWTPAIQLYELMLHRTPPSDLLQWLLSSSGTSLRILEMRDLPSARTSVDLAVCCPHIQSLRFMRYNAYSAAILHQCTNLVELVLLNVPLSLPALPSSLEHFALLIQTYTAHVDLRPVVKAVESLPRLKVFTFVGESGDLKAICDAKGVALHTTLRKYWILDDPVKTTRFPRRLSVSNFYSMS